MGKTLIVIGNMDVDALDMSLRVVQALTILPLDKEEKNVYW